MQPIYLTIGLHPLMIIPDIQAHLNGHAAITHTYHIYRQSGLAPKHEIFENEEMHGLDENDHPDYIGHLVFEIPEKLFNYFPKGIHPPDGGEVTELVEQLSHYRDNPGLWQNS
ncbi:hypothetical protein [Mucilaginibacter jinjuensis]|uniref:Uncharacterized protein n=1 Tax=Mucilaginibacter jinjuensis TaxID=1176721 RepID=A0ABY7TCS4_9SPHI|nr:hypothetical protein [Mucilaginibacter jinjuensis]WCT13422.1 hypothetical protein PQO05_05675 [Mucilaginibacter jinjuensis]